MFHDVLQYKSSKSACLLLYLGSHVCISLGFISCNIHLFMSTFVSRCVCCLYQYPLYTVMVFNNWRNGIPVAFFAISRSREQDLTPVLQALHSRVLKKNATWSPSSIVVDCAQAEINTMRYRQSLYISFIFSGVALGLGILHSLPCAGLFGQMPRYSSVFGTSERPGQKTPSKNLQRWGNVQQSSR